MRLYQRLLSITVLVLMVLFIIAPLPILAGTSSVVVITARPLVVPEVTNGVGATNIVYDGARLNGEVVDTGNENPFCYFYWGLVDEGTNPALWTDNSSEGAKPAGAFSHDIGGLLPSTTYFYTTAGVNSAGTDWAPNSANFTTPAAGVVLLPPTNLVLTDLGAITINATWDMGVGSTKTYMRIKRESRPTSITDGETFYFDIGTSANMSGLELGSTTWWVSAWGENSGNYSATYTYKSIGGSGMQNFAMIFLGLGLLALTLIFRRPAIGIACAICWLVWGLYSLSISSATWDIYYDFFIVGVGLFITILIESMILRPKVADIEPEEDMWDRARTEYLERRKSYLDRIRDRGGRGNRRIEGKSKVVDKDFDETGEL